MYIFLKRTLLSLGWRAHFVWEQMIFSEGHHSFCARWSWTIEVGMITLICFGRYLSTDNSESLKPDFSWMLLILCVQNTNMSLVPVQVASQFSNAGWALSFYCRKKRTVDAIAWMEIAGNSCHSRVSLCVIHGSCFCGCILTHLDLSKTTWKDCSVWRKYFIFVSFWSNSKAQIELKAWQIP